LDPPFTKVDLQKEYDITTNISIGLALSGKTKSSAGFIFTYK
jgi:hypothetical protein